jgi:hypothetical protein
VTRTSRVTRTTRDTASAASRFSGTGRTWVGGLLGGLAVSPHEGDDVGSAIIFGPPFPAIDIESGKIACQSRSAVREHVCANPVASRNLSRHGRRLRSARYRGPSTWRCGSEFSSGTQNQALCAILAPGP